MKKSQFNEERMVKILREADHTPVVEVAKKPTAYPTETTRPARTLD